MLRTPAPLNGTLGVKGNPVPNCDFLAAKSDLEAVLDYVFTSHEFTVYEAYSEPEAELRTFGSTAEVADAHPLGRCKGTAPSVLLQLLARGSGAATIERYALDPSSCNGKTFRYRSSGWGLIQLHLGGIGPKGLVSSHTNHNSPERALKWASTYPELSPPSAWDWKLVQASSRKLNRVIHTLAVAKDGSRPVLAEAAACLAAR
ncbi:MAG: hypothetical protein IPK20_04970 [Betaproteobacteria bacterium]|nr:hypothetical protein [Betaproteobacteria bacterium]